MFFKVYFIVSVLVYAIILSFFLRKKGNKEKHILSSKDKTNEILNKKLPTTPANKLRRFRELADKKYGAKHNKP